VAKKTQALHRISSVLSFWDWLGNKQFRTPQIRSLTASNISTSVDLKMRRHPRWSAISSFNWISARVRTEFATESVSTSVMDIEEQYDRNLSKSCLSRSAIAAATRAAD